MNTFRKWLPALALLALSVPAFALSTYSEGVSNITTWSKAGSTMSLECTLTSGHVYNTSGQRVYTGFTFTRGTYPSYTASFSFSSAFTGTVKVTGCLNSTSHASDFAPTNHYATGHAYGAINYDRGTDGADVVRVFDLGGQNYRFVIVGGYGEFDSQGLVSATVRGYITADGKFTWGVSASSGSATCSMSGLGQCAVVYNVSSFPSNVAQILSGTLSGSGTWSSFTDLR